MKTKKFMCAERLQRLLMSVMMLIILALLASNHSTIGLGLLAFVAIMLAVYFFFDFCPSTFMLEKIFGSCFCECKDENES